MGVMIYQQYTTAIKEAYATRENVAAQHAEAARCRAWLESLDISPRLRDSLVEEIAALEEGFREVLAKQARAASNHITNNQS